MSNHHLTEPILDASYLEDEMMGMLLTGDDDIGYYPTTVSQNNNTITSTTASILDDLFPPSTSTSLLSLSQLSLSPMQFSSSNEEQIIHKQTFSTDSLDKSLHLETNPDNYKLTFQSMTLHNNDQSNGNVNSEKTCSFGKYNLPDLNFLENKICDLKVHQKSRIRPSTAPHPTTTNRNQIHDWESLKVLLPPQYIEKEMEKHDEEKEIDEKEEKVVLRQKRFSLAIDEKRSKIKRFSLQEIQEVGEVCKGIEETLKVFEEYKGDVVFKGNKRVKKKRDVGQPIKEAVRDLLKDVVGKVCSESGVGDKITERLCPALYSLFSDGLSDGIDTLWGRVRCTVWGVIEASVSEPPRIQILNELVMRINSESELMGEGPLKFNAFICGLLNLNILPTYLSLLSQKEPLLRTHYTPTAFLYNINSTQKAHFDSLLSSLGPLHHHSFALDIFHETKLLHTKIFQKMKRSYSDERPKKNANSTQKISKSKTQQNLDSKFKKLQMQWELLGSGTGSDCSVNKSRIPRWTFNKKK